jgi:hypothetical protein
MIDAHIYEHIMVIEFGCDISIYAHARPDLIDRDISLHRPINVFSLQNVVCVCVCVNASLIT